MSGLYLRHDYWPCNLPACADKDDHCGETWCGAPRNHPLHTCYREPLIQPAVRSDVPLECMMHEEERIPE